MAKRKDKAKRGRRGTSLKAFHKSSWRRIRETLGRFLSIMLISAVGIGFFGGVNATGGAMIRSAEMFYEERNLSDFRIFSALGFTKDNIEELRALPEVETVSPVYYSDLYVPQKDQNHVIRFFSLPGPDDLNQLELLEGRFPETDNEVVIDELAVHVAGFEVGQQLRWTAPPEGEGGVSLESMSEAFENVDNGTEGTTQPGDTEKPDQTTKPEVMLPHALKRQERSLNADPAPPADTEAEDIEVIDVEEAVEIAEEEEQQQETTEDETPADIEPIQVEEQDKPEESLEDLIPEGYDFEIPESLKELDQMDPEALEKSFDERLEDPEIKEFMELKPEDILEDENDALIQLAKSLSERELKHESYTIVGVVSSPVYLDYERDVSQLGSGAVSFNAWVFQSEFKMPDPLMLAIKLCCTEGMKPYSKDYAAMSDDRAEILQRMGDIDTKNRTATVRASLREKQDLVRRANRATRNLLNDVEAEITHMEALLERAGPDLDQVERDLQDSFLGGEEELTSGKRELSDARRQYQEGMAAYQEANLDYQVKGLELKIAEAQLASAEQQLALIEEELQNAEPLLNRLDYEVENIRYQIQGAEYVLQLLATGPMDELSFNQVIQELQPYFPDLANFLVAYVNPNQDNASEMIRDSLLASLASAKASLSQAEMLYEYQRQKIDSFYQRIENSRNEVEVNKQAVANGKAQWEAGAQQLADAKAMMEAASSQISEGEKEVAEGEKTLNQIRDQIRLKLSGARLQIAEGKNKVAAARAKFEAEKQSARERLEIGDTALSQAERMLFELPESWFVYEREDNPGYAGLKADADRISAVAQIFPVFLFLVAALVCLTTMTRMIEEDRGEMGALKALGYRASTISSRYVTYAFLATLAGAVLGGIIGPLLFPGVIMKAYSQMYEAVPFRLDFNLTYVGIATALQLFFTLAATFAAIGSELKETPASLLQPKAPKPGKRIFLEYIKPIWNHLSFSKKLTARNIFRYKARMLMTVAGISGCTALMLAGFGIRNSVFDIRDRQFDELWLMDGVAILSGQGVDEGDEAFEELSASPELTHLLPTRYETYTIEPKERSEGRNTAISMICAEDDRRFQDMFKLRVSRRGPYLDLPDEGVILSIKIAKEMGYEIGDTVVLQDTEGRRLRAPLVAVTENYVNHSMFISPAAYQKMTKKPPTFNAFFYTYAKGMSREEQVEVETRFMESPWIVSVQPIVKTLETITSMMSSMGAVVAVLVLTAALLAFIVLYNLTNINVTERVREIATFRVLGFYDKEVAQYIFRENLILTIMGAAAGIPLGVLLHRFIIETMEVDTLMFGREIHWWGYVVSVVLTILFAYIVNFSMLKKIRSINMVEALKGVE